MRAGHGRHRVRRAGDRQAGDLLGRERDREAEHREQTAMERTAGCFQGSRRSAAISAATKAMHAALITPNAKSAAISGQQQAMQTPPCSTPIRSARAGRGAER